MLKTHYHTFSKGEKNYIDAAGAKDGEKKISHLGHLENGGFLFEGKVKITDPKGKRKEVIVEGVSCIKPSC